MKRILLILFGLMAGSLPAFSQEKQEIGASDYANTSVEMADAFRADGKIYVVVAVILVLLAGLFLYLYLLDRKITRMEKQWDNPAE